MTTTLDAAPAAQAVTRDLTACLARIRRLEADLQLERDSIRLARQGWLDTVDAIDSPLMVLDEGLRVVRANRAYALRAGMNFPDLIGRPFWECFPRRAQPQLAVPMQFELDGGEAFMARELPLGDAGPHGATRLYLFEDITDRQRADRQARAMVEVAMSDDILKGDVEAVARQVTEAASRATGVARANVWLFNEAEDELRCVDLFEAASGAHTTGMVLREAEFQNEFQALKHACYVDASEPLTDPRTSGYVEGYLKPLGITSMLDTVVQVSGKHIGLLCLEHVGRPHTWRPDEIAFAAQLADKIAVVLSNRETRRAQDALRRSEKRFRTIFEQAPVGISECSIAGRYLAVNARLCEITGYSAPELLERSFRDITHPADVGSDERNVEKLLAGEIPVYSTEKRYLRKDGGTVWAALTLTSVGEGADRYLLATAEDVTEHKAAEEALERRERHYRKLIEGSSDAFFVVDAAGRLTYRSDSAIRLTGYQAAEVLGKELVSLVTPDSLPEARRAIAEVLENPEKRSRAELGIARKDGSLLEVEAIGKNLLGDPDVAGIVVTARDITERKRTEKTLRDNRERLSLATHSARIGIWDWDVVANKLVWDARMYALYGMREEDFSGAYDAWQAGLHPDDRAAGDAAIAAALAGTKDFDTEFRVVWPNGETHHIEAHAVVTRAADGTAVRMIGVNWDITERRRATEKLRSSLEGTIEAIGATMESRDPYTAGHQHRVATLAKAIAAEMGLAAHIVEGVYFGSLIHDIGKMQVPSEILTKPTRLTKLEFELIKVHAQAGYDIIKGVEFPWPVADMVHQHHERLDGSGYPQALKGDAIALEARILAVADVVEAMSSHRPYRPGLGIEAALKEVEAKRGKWFEPAAVDACVRLFREKDFKLAGQ